MVGFRERFQREFAGTVKPVRWDDQAASATAYVQEQTATLPSHIGEHSAVDANGAEKIRVHNLLGLFGGDGFCQTLQAVTRIVYGDINSTSLLRDHLHCPIHGNVIGDIEFQHVKRKRFPCGKGPNCRCICCVASLEIAHRCEDGVTVAREGFRDHSAEPRARTGDEHYLFRFHDVSL